MLLLSRFLYWLLPKDCKGLLLSEFDDIFNQFYIFSFMLTPLFIVLNALSGFVGIATILAVALIIGFIANIALSVVLIAIPVIMIMAIYGFSFPLPFLLIALSTLVFTELIFFLKPDKPSRKENTFLFTVRIKCEAFIESLLIIGNSNALIHLDWSFVLPWVGYLGVGVIGLGGLYGYFKVNEYLKFKRGV